MGIINVLYGIRKRLSEKELERGINILDDERRRRELIRDDEVIKGKRNKNV